MGKGSLLCIMQSSSILYPDFFDSHKIMRAGMLLVTFVSIHISHKACEYDEYSAGGFFPLCKMCATASLSGNYNNSSTSYPHHRIIMHRIPTFSSLFCCVVALSSFFLLSTRNSLHQQVLFIQIYCI